MYIATSDNIKHEVVCDDSGDVLVGWDSFQNNFSDLAGEKSRVPTLFAVRRTPSRPSIEAQMCNRSSA